MFLNDKRKIAADNVYTRSELLGHQVVDTGGWVYDDNILTTVLFVENDKPNENTLRKTLVVYFKPTTDIVTKVTLDGIELNDFLPRSTCARCGGNLIDGKCEDQTCAFSDHLQGCPVGWTGHQYQSRDGSAKCNCKNIPVPGIHVKVNYTDGTEQTCDVPDLEHAAHEIHETVTGSDFAINVESVFLVDEKGNEIKPLYATWKLELKEE